MKELISIVVEWENALLSEADRSVRMLRELRAQAQELSPTKSFELLLLYDAEELAAGDLHAMLEANLGAPDEVIDWRLIEGEQTGYYQIKDQGVRASAGELVVFLDSDVIPEKGWLRAMLEPFESEEVEIVAGKAYIDADDFFSRSFALAWFFPLRGGDGPLETVEHFFVNNVAFRRALYLRFPFPEVPGASRGACVLMAKNLVAASVPIYSNPNARVSHPPPNGGRHFFWRALAQGRDRVLRERQTGSSGAASLAASVGRLVRNSGGAFVKILTGFPRVQLNPLLVPGALVVASAYYGLYWCGEVATHFGSQSVQRIRI